MKRLRGIMEDAVDRRLILILALAGDHTASNNGIYFGLKHHYYHL
jgi:hypothetical protein